ncbi:GntR family transcriptional regulator [Paucibacter soli]|uniref:GntR family transcriptional regulator n=1 Tax=Paucibacter soli TaxID=3133433 RepID=UPI0030AE190C
MPEASTQQDACYQQLRAQLSLGRFLPGERLKIRQLAEELGLGQMPVRAALQRLAAEGALVNVPNAGVMVPQLSVPEFDDVLGVRMLLEGEATERACLRLSAAELAELRALGRQMAQALADADAKAYLDANELFHLRLYRAAGSPSLLALIETVWLKVGPLSNRLFEHEAALGVLNQAHDDMLLALRRRDPAAARHALERDLFIAGQFLRQSCRQAQGDTGAAKASTCPSGSSE